MNALPKGPKAKSILRIQKEKQQIQKMKEQMQKQLEQQLKRMREEMTEMPVEYARPLYQDLARKLHNRTLYAEDIMLFKIGAAWLLDSRPKKKPTPEKKAKIDKISKEIDRLTRDFE